ncbi:MAG: hypothetical protein V4596_11925 [Bdellovibrionota bacterium]
MAQPNEQTPKREDQSQRSDPSKFGEKDGNNQSRNDKNDDTRQDSNRKDVKPTDIVREAPTKSHS